MNKATFPSFLSSKATIYLNLTRHDLLVLGLGYLVLSKLCSNALVSIGLNTVILLGFKYITREVPSGFFKHINEPKNIQWSYSLRGIDER